MKNENDNCFKGDCDHPDTGQCVVSLTHERDILRQQCNSLVEAGKLIIADWDASGKRIVQGRFIDRMEKAIANSKEPTQ